MIRVQDPHNLEAEQAFLGSILKEQRRSAGAGRLVRPADFFDERHAFILQAMLDVEKAGQPLDLVTLSDRLNGNLADVGGYAYLVELEHNPMISAENLDAYAALIRKYARLRRLITGAGRIVRLAHRAGANVNVWTRLWLWPNLPCWPCSKRTAWAGRAARVLIRRYFDRARNSRQVLASRPACRRSMRSAAACKRVISSCWPASRKRSKRAWPCGSPKGGPGGGKVALFSLESSADQVVQRLLAGETNLTPSACGSAMLNPNGRRCFKPASAWLNSTFT